jgi:hypothetical protein
MNAASTIQRREVHPTALDRVALSVGNALVAWGERKSEARVVTIADREEHALRVAAAHEAQTALTLRDAGANYPLYRIF